jgi:hypothetical protein
LTDLFEIDYSQVYIVDELDMRKEPSLQDVFDKGASFYKLKLLDEDYERVFYLLRAQPYDIVIDLTTNTNCFKLIEAVR